MSRYILVSDRKDLSANDPVARFHLGNGASVHKLNHMGDTSVNGIKQSAGMMINYLYDPYRRKPLYGKAVPVRRSRNDLWGALTSIRVSRTYIGTF